MKGDKNTSLILFLDDWQPLPHSEMASGVKETKRWRLQTLLSSNPWGIPVMAFEESYENMFSGQPFKTEDYGYENISAMVYDLPDLFAVQEPDELTALLFPKYPNDKILHDARLGHEFNQQLEDQDSNSNDQLLISHAWLDRDTDFPPDVVLAGEQYNELILPMTSANIPGTYGIHRAIIAGVANPNSFYINIESIDTNRFDELTSEIYQFFMENRNNISSYEVPEQFIYAGFPCLVFSKQSRCWERCLILSYSHRTNQVLVEYVDFGGAATVDRIYLYLMPRRFLDLPKQAIHCSLIGVRPKTEHNDKWSRNVSCRMRSFSHQRYWLDVLLVEPKITTDANSVITDRGKSKGVKRERQVIQKKPDYEAIICDRHDSYGSMDMLLNDILVAETYGSLDTDRAAEYKSLKASFKGALANIARPINPFDAKWKKFWPFESYKDEQATNNPSMK